MVVDEKNLSILKESIQKFAHRKLNRAVDCDLIAHTISESTNSLINGITFKRLFGFTKYPYNPSIQTLDILSKFVGFKNWYDFENYHAQFQPINKSEINIYLSFYDIDFYNDILPYEAGLQSFSRKIAHRFREDPKTFIRHLPEFMSKPYFRMYYVEHLPDYDNLCNYSHHVFYAYLKYAETDDALLYGSALKFLYLLWSDDRKGCTDCYIFIMEEIKIDASFHPYLIGRYFAIRLLYNFHFLQASEEELEVIYLEYLELHKDLVKNGKHFQDFPASEYIIVEALFNCKLYKKCIEVIELSYQEFSITMEFIKKGYYRHLQLFWLMAQRKLNKSFEIQVYLNKIEPNNFYFISKKYFTVLFYYANFLSTNDVKYYTLAAQLCKEMNNKYTLQVLFGDTIDENSQKV